MRGKIVSLFLFFSLLCALATNINSQYVDNETPTEENNERDFVKTEMPRTRAALTVPKEGVYDNIKDTKNAAGVMTARSYYYKGKLVEKRTYTSTGSTNCRMKNKYLYYSNGSTIERHRTYSNTGKTCYNLQTKTYNTAGKIQSHSIYEGKVKGKIIEIRNYESTGTYYKNIGYYKNGIITRRKYWNGKSPNYVTHIANYNKAGTAWVNATYYFESGKKKEYVTYNGVEGNVLRKTATRYDGNGDKILYIKYDSKGKYDEVFKYSDDELDQKDKYENDNIIQTKYYEEGLLERNITYYPNLINNMKNAVTYDPITQSKIQEEYYLIGNVMEKEFFYKDKALIQAQYYEKGYLSKVDKYEFGSIINTEIITGEDSLILTNDEGTTFEESETEEEYILNVIDQENGASLEIIYNEETKETKLDGKLVNSEEFFTTVNQLTEENNDGGNKEISTRKKKKKRFRSPTRYVGPGKTCSGNKKCISNKKKKRPKISGQAFFTRAGCALSVGVAVGSGGVAWGAAVIACGQAFYTK